MDWVRGKCLGKGSYGSVFLAIPTNIISPPLAVKSALIIDSFSLQKELKILLSLFGSEGIIQCYGDCLSHENGMTIYNLLLEYAPGGSLADLINKYGGKIPECDVRRYTRMILKGLSSIHNNGYVHCDLKPANILVFPSDQQDFQLKIADFGLAKSLTKTIQGNSFTSTLSVELPYTCLLNLKHVKERERFLKNVFHETPLREVDSNMLLDHPFIVDEELTSSFEQEELLPPSLSDDVVKSMCKLILSDYSPGQGLFSSADRPLSLGSTCKRLNFGPIGMGCKETEKSLLSKDGLRTKAN
ncbi:hypothetical protein GH714_001665 [Hevea brasiliensis]|uniref:Protein kinase domain-containing protein n=1 Tax=Hevea brasiliensis TaxID=3981 RepID=A0A6A6MAT6_HEVBR|nr:hypothetical protein GH714_001665 [Hevea brasiliensis]